MEKQRFYRTDCSFTYRGNIRVDHRIHFELAYNEEEASEKTRNYLESWGYTEIQINECHEETEEEKYGRPEVTEPVKVETMESVKSVSVPSENTDELF